MKLKERQAVTCASVLTVFFTILYTATALDGQRTETFVKTLGACLVAVGIVWFVIHKLNTTQNPPER
jgi:ABC-type nickel/cobalt efflux system permease component RcnA